MSPVLTALSAPLFQGALALRAEAALEAIVADLVSLPLSDPARRDHGLAGGGAGVVLALSRLADSGRVRPGEGQIMARLERAVAGLGEARHHAGLFGGFTGTAWLVEHLQENFLDPDPSLNDEIDEILVDTLRRGEAPPQHDLIDGLAGLGVYGLERFPHGRSGELLETILDILEWRAAWSDQGAFWPAPELPRDILDARGLIGPSPGSVDLGLSHGMPGILAFLSGLLPTGIGGDRTRTLLEAGMAWLLDREGTEDGRSRFTYAIRPGETRSRSCRLAWCYGDIGVALALRLAGRNARCSRWSAKALEIMEVAAQRPILDSGVQDPMLCHGAMGVAHAFHRFHRDSGREVFRRAALDWTEHALHFREEGKGTGGFQRFTHGAWARDPTLLEGSAGLALGLLAGLQVEEPSWDRFMLYSLPE